MGRLGKRIGVSVCRRLQSIINSVETSWYYSRAEKQSYFPGRRYANTPTRRPADTLPQPAAHFERNDITIICETVHKMMVSLWPTRQDSILLEKARGFQIVSVILFSLAPRSRASTTTKCWRKTSELSGYQKGPFYVECI
jgi:hypothetical protein